MQTGDGRYLGPMSGDDTTSDGEGCEAPHCAFQKQVPALRTITWQPLRLPMLLIVLARLRELSRSHATLSYLCAFSLPVEEPADTSSLLWPLLASLSHATTRRFFSSALLAASRTAWCLRQASA